MWPFRHREVRVVGLRERLGVLGLTRGAFRVTRYFDADLVNEPVEVQRFVAAHEEGHAVRLHGLLALLLFPARPFLVPFLETMADRYAVRVVGRAAALKAIRRLHANPTGQRGLSWWGVSWRTRAARAGLL